MENLFYLLYSILNAQQKLDINSTVNSIYEHKYLAFEMEFDAWEKFLKVDIFTLFICQIKIRQQCSIHFSNCVHKIQIGIWTHIISCKQQTTQF